MTDIKGTTELVKAANGLALEMIKLLKDGAQTSDVTVFLSDLMTDSEGLKSALVAAYNDVKGIPAELKDIDYLEGLELAKIQLEYIPKIIAAFK